MIRTTAAILLAISRIVLFQRSRRYVEWIPAPARRAPVQGRVFPDHIRCDGRACVGESTFSTVTKDNDISALTDVTDGEGWVQYQATVATADATKTPSLDRVTLNYTASSGGPLRMAIIVVE